MRANLDSRRVSGQPIYSDLRQWAEGEQLLQVVSRHRPRNHPSRADSMAAAARDEDGVVASGRSLVRSGITDAARWDPGSGSFRTL
jgi:hypothetical protein